MESSPVMCDWISAEVPDRVGLPVNSGQVMRVDRDGQIEWTTPTRLSVEGSHSSNMTFRAVGASAADDSRDRASWELRPGERDSGLEVSGNPAKFLRGHNLFGSSDVAELLLATVAKAKDAIWPDLFEEPEIDVSDALLSRIDLTGSWLLERESDVLPVLRAMEETVWVPYRGRGVMDRGGSTLYYGRAEKNERSKDWALKLYWKGPEVTAHPLPRPAYSVPGVLDDLNRTIRVELTLRTAELKRLGLRKVGHWTPAKVREIWEAYVSKLNLEKAPRVLVNLDAADLSQYPDLKPRHILALSAWRAGTDLRQTMPERTFYRLRKEIDHLTSWDIANPRPKSNVVPLLRVVTLTQPAQVPSWADDLTAALSTAA